MGKSWKRGKKSEICGMGRMGPGHTLMAKCSCMEILPGEGGGGTAGLGGPAPEGGEGEGEEEEDGGRERREDGLLGGKWEWGGGGLETLIGTTGKNCGEREKELFKTQF